MAQGGFGLNALVRGVDLFQSALNPDRILAQMDLHSFNVALVINSHQCYAGVVVLYSA